MSIPRTLGAPTEQQTTFAASSSLLLALPEGSVRDRLLMMRIIVLGVPGHALRIGEFDLGISPGLGFCFGGASFLTAGSRGGAVAPGAAWAQGPSIELP